MDKECLKPSVTEEQRKHSNEESCPPDFSGTLTVKSGSNDSEKDMRGVNVVPFLELIGLPDSVVNILKNSQSGNALTAYAMFKIATPARYTVTLGGTSFTVKYLRSHGYMSTPPPVKEYLQDRMEETKELLTEKMEETKDRLTEKLQETKEKVSFKKKVE
ncbi:hypothetical protein TREES_T100002163 [Tupaia chinensis]|uniref:Protein FAM210A n=1 Tax=Tupaia chinensis TaxID=246437 RepID=L8YCE8_TUPCH|nr:hypothetical protein TREES_T100002163 [Tupaia chinensis]